MHTILHVKATVNIIEESSSSTHFTSLLSQRFSVEYGTTLIVGYAFEPCDDDHDDNDHHGENATTLLLQHYSNEKGAKLTQQYYHTTCYIICISFFSNCCSLNVRFGKKGASKLSYKTAVSLHILFPLFLPCQ